MYSFGPQDPQNPPVLAAGINIFDSFGVTVQDLVLKHEIFIKNSSFINILRNSIEVDGYSGNPGTHLKGTGPRWLLHALEFDLFK